MYCFTIYSNEFALAFRTDGRVVDRLVIFIAPISEDSRPMVIQSISFVRPYSMPARKASPQPVGSRSCAGFAHGMSMRVPPV